VCKENQVAVIKTIIKEVVSKGNVVFAITT